MNNKQLLGLGFLSFFLIIVGCRESNSQDSSWDAQLQVEPALSTSINGESIFSSGKLLAEWSAPTGTTVDHYLLSAVDGVAGTVVEAEVEDAEEVLLTGLKSQTEYRFSVRACLDADCESALTADEMAQASTSSEYWQIQGTGNGYDSATKVVEVGTGSTLSYVLPYGDWAPKALQGVVKYLFNAHSNEYGNGMLISQNEAGGAGVDNFSSFDITGLFFERDCENVGKASSFNTCDNGELQMLAFQMVPLVNGSVRLFFEAYDSSNVQNSQPVTQIYSLDSQDGYEAEDFNPDPNKDYCSATDTIPGGDCEPLLLIGDETDENSPLVQARQQKVGYPKQDSWLWDESAGTFMVITGEDRCGQTRDGLFYAIWDGKEWEVEMDEDCAAPLVLDAHGPVLVHMGESNYKLYYENYEYSDREKFLFDTKPFRVLYTSGTEFDDWENEADAREVYFLWPDGSLLDDQEEAGLGDHVIWSPDENLETQIMYMNLGGFDNLDWKQPPVGLGMAILLNP